MAAISCDICGGTLSMDASGDFAVCDSCGMKHTKDRVKAMAQEVTGTVAVSNIASIESLMKRGNLALEDSDWKTADEYFDKVLDIDAEYAPAYIGKLCAELVINKEANLINRSVLTMFLNYQKALRFAQGNYLSKIQAYDLFNQDLLSKNKQRLEIIQKKVARKSGDKHTVILKSDGTVIATGNKNIITKSILYYHPSMDSDKYEYETVDDGEYAGSLCTSSKYWGGKGPCDTKDWCDIVAIAVGEMHTVGLKKNGTVIATGLNRSVEYYTEKYKRGYPRFNEFYRTYSRVIGEYKGGACDTKNWCDIIAVASGSYHTVGLTKHGTVETCGRNESKQCETREWRDIVMIAAADDYTIGLKADGTVIATGSSNSKVNQWKDIVSIHASGNTIFGIKSDDSIVINSKGVNVSGSEEQIINKMEEEKKKREEKERIEKQRRDEQERIEKQRREEQERIERERKAEQERIEQAERARRDAEDARQNAEYARQREIRERRHKIGRGTSVFLAVLATIMIFVLSHFDFGLNIIVLLLLAGLNLIPFLVIFKADEYSNVKKGIFLCVNIIVSMITFIAYVNYEHINKAALIVSSVIFGICNVTSCITAIVFPKD